MSGFPPPGCPQSCHCSRPDRVASLLPPPTVGITVRLLCFQEPPSAKLVCFSPTSHLFVSVCSLRVRLFAPTRSKTFSEDASCRRQLPVGSMPRQVLLSFPWRARLNCCRGQGQLGTRPQPGQVPWSGLVPSSSHQPWGGRGGAGCGLRRYCVFWKAHDSVGAGGECGEFALAPLQDRKA